MVGSKIIAAIRSDGKVYPLDDGSSRGGVPGGSILSANHAQFANLVNMKLRPSPIGSQHNLNESCDPLSSNNRIQASVMDLGKRLVQCARDNDINGVETMMRKGAPFASDWLGMTAIHFAAMNDRYDICNLLLTAGINKDARTKVDRTPLHLAAFYGHERIAELLLKCQCAVNPRDMLRMTPLHWAVENGHKSIVRLLLKHQADVTAISKFGKTPIALAVVTEQADILQELEAARQLQQSKKFNEQHEKETNEAVNSIMSQSKDEDEPQIKKPKLNSESEKVAKSNIRLSTDTLNYNSEGKVLDNSAINLLKSHGISMINDDEDSSNNLLTTALQNGRQLVLSEGGKLLLNETKRMVNNKMSEAIKALPRSHTTNTPVAEVKIKSEFPPVLLNTMGKIRPNIISKSKEVSTRDVNKKEMMLQNNNDKPYKNIRIISMKDFKKLYGTGNLKSLQKIEANPNKSQPLRVQPDEKRPLSQSISIEEIQEYDPTGQQEDSDNPDEDEENDLPPNIVKVSPSELDDSSDADVPETQVIHPPVLQSSQPRLFPVRIHQNSTNASRITLTRASSVAGASDLKQDRTPVIPLLTIPEICRQLLELRKHNDELRRKYEIVQKENEEFRSRLERMETLLLVERTEDDNMEV